MTFDEFVAILDKKNQYWENLAVFFETDYARGELVIERKGQDLVEVVRRCKEHGLYPVVDKRLGLVFGCEGHGVTRSELYRYYYYAKNIHREPYINLDEGEDLYISKGYGWFISSIRPHIIVAGAKYHPDQYDKEIFAIQRVQAEVFPRADAREIFSR